VAASDDRRPPAGRAKAPPDDVDEEDDDEQVIDDADVDPPGPAADGTIPDKLYFRIGEVAQLVGVDSHVLRYWESEFKMKPHRSNSGQRLYRKADLSRFFRIRHLLHDEGYTIAGARKVLQGGSGGPAAVDVQRLRKAIERLGTLRRKIRGFRQDMLPPQG
jgi:DNA-binding transcriptional MerR regulator